MRTKKKLISLALSAVMVAGLVLAGSALPATAVEEPLNAVEQENLAPVSVEEPVDESPSTTDEGDGPKEGAGDETPTSEVPPDVQGGGEEGGAQHGPASGGITPYGTPSQLEGLVQPSLSRSGSPTIDTGNISDANAELMLNLLIANNDVFPGTKLENIVIVVRAENMILRGGADAAGTTVTIDEATNTATVHMQEIDLDTNRGNTITPTSLMVRFANGSVANSATGRIYVESITVDDPDAPAPDPGEDKDTITVTYAAGGQPSYNYTASSRPNWSYNNLTRSPSGQNLAATYENESTNGSMDAGRINISQLTGSIGFTRTTPNTAYEYATELTGGLKVTLPSGLHVKYSDVTASISASGSTGSYRVLDQYGNEVTDGNAMLSDVFYVVATFVRADGVTTELATPTITVKIDAVYYYTGGAYTNIDADTALSQTITFSALNVDDAGLPGYGRVRGLGGDWYDLNQFTGSQNYTLTKNSLTVSLSAGTMSLSASSWSYSRDHENTTNSWGSYSGADTTSRGVMYRDTLLGDAGHKYQWLQASGVRNNSRYGDDPYELDEYWFSVRNYNTSSSSYIVGFAPGSYLDDSKSTLANFTVTVDVYDRGTTNLVQTLKFEFKADGTLVSGDLSLFDTLSYSASAPDFYKLKDSVENDYHLHLTYQYEEISAYTNNDGMGNSVTGFRLDSPPRFLAAADLERPYTNYTNDSTSSEFALSYNAKGTIDSVERNVWSTNQNANRASLSVRYSLNYSDGNAVTKTKQVVDTAGNPADDPTLYEGGRLRYTLRYTAGNSVGNVLLHDSMSGREEIDDPDPDDYFAKVSDITSMTVRIDRASGQGGTIIRLRSANGGYLAPSDSGVDYLEYTLTQADLITNLNYGGTAIADYIDNNTAATSILKEDFFLWFDGGTLVKGDVITVTYDVDIIDDYSGHDTENSVRLRAWNRYDADEVMLWSPTASGVKERIQSTIKVGLTATAEPASIEQTNSSIVTVRGGVTEIADVETRTETTAPIFLIAVSPRAQVMDPADPLRVEKYNGQGTSLDREYDGGGEVIPGTALLPGTHYDLVYYDNDFNDITSEVLSDYAQVQADYALIYIGVEFRTNVTLAEGEAIEIQFELYGQTVGNANGAVYFVPEMTPVGRINADGELVQKTVRWHNDASVTNNAPATLLEGKLTATRGGDVIIRQCADGYQRPYINSSYSLTITEVPARIQAGIATTITSPDTTTPANPLAGDRLDVRVTGGVLAILYEDGELDEATGPAFLITVSGRLELREAGDLGAERFDTRGNGSLLAHTSDPNVTAIAAARYHTVLYDATGVDITALVNDPLEDEEYADVAYIGVYFDDDVTLEEDQAIRFTLKLVSTGDTASAAITNTVYFAPHTGDSPYSDTVNLVLQSGIDYAEPVIAHSSSVGTSVRNTGAGQALVREMFMDMNLPTVHTAHSYAPYMSNTFAVTLYSPQQSFTVTTVVNNITASNYASYRGGYIHEGEQLSYVNYVQNTSNFYNHNTIEFSHIVAVLPAGQEYVDGTLGVRVGTGYLTDIDDYTFTVDTLPSGQQRITVTFKDGKGAPRSDVTNSASAQQGNHSLVLNYRADVVDAAAAMADGATTGVARHTVAAYYEPYDLLTNPGGTVTPDTETDADTWRTAATATQYRTPYSVNLNYRNSHANPGLATTLNSNLNKDNMRGSYLYTIYNANVYWDVTVTNFSNSAASSTRTRATEDMEYALVVVLPQGFSLSAVKNSTGQNPASSGAYEALPDYAAPHQYINEGGSRVLVWDNLNDSDALALYGTLKLTVRGTLNVNATVLGTQIVQGYLVPSGFFESMDINAGTYVEASEVVLETLRNQSGVVMDGQTSLNVAEGTPMVTASAPITIMNTQGLVAQTSATIGSRWTSTPATTISGDQGDTIVYKTDFYNTAYGSGDTFSDIVIVQGLPHEGDAYLTLDANKGSHWAPEYKWSTPVSVTNGSGVAVDPGEYTIYYASKDMDFGDDDWYSTGAASGWYTESEWNQSVNPGYFKVVFDSNYKLASGERLIITWEMTIPDPLDINNPANTLAWLTTGYRLTSSSSSETASIRGESGRIGITALGQTNLSLDVTKTLADAPAGTYTFKLQYRKLQTAAWQDVNLTAAANGSDINASGLIEVTVATAGGSETVTVYGLDEGIYRLVEVGASTATIQPSYSSDEIGLYLGKGNPREIEVTNAYKRFSVSYNANGGSGSHSVGNIVISRKHTVLTDAATGITRSGYTFRGWNTQANGSGTAYAAGSQITVTGNVTLYAQWSQNGGGGEESSSNPGGSSTSRRTSSTSTASGASSDGGASSAVTGSSSVAGATSGGVSSSGSGFGDRDTQTIDEGMPIGDFSVTDGWSLISMVLSILSVLLALVFLITRLLPGRKGSLLLKILVPISGLVPGVIFLIMDKLAGQVYLITHSTLWVGAFACLFLVLLVVALIQGRKEREEDDGDDTAMA